MKESNRAEMRITCSFSPAQDKEAEIETLKSKVSKPS